jgi:hypothetical protein
MRVKKEAVEHEGDVIGYIYERKCRDCGKVIQTIEE